MKILKRTFLRITNNEEPFGKTEIIDEESGYNLSNFVNGFRIDMQAGECAKVKLRIIGINFNIKALLDDIEVICPHCGESIER